MVVDVFLSLNQHRFRRTLTDPCENFLQLHRLPRTSLEGMAVAATTVYVPSENPEELYLEAHLISDDDDSYQVRLPNGEEKSFPRNKCLPAPELGAKGQSDMIFLEHLNEVAVMQYVRLHFPVHAFLYAKLSHYQTII